MASLDTTQTPTEHGNSAPKAQHKRFEVATVVELKTAETTTLRSDYIAHFQR